MLKFTFNFIYRGSDYEADCQAFPLDGTTELQVSPNDSELFHQFGVRVLAQHADGSISTDMPPEPEAFDYLMALVKGASTYFDDPHNRINQ